MFIKNKEHNWPENLEPYAYLNLTDMRTVCRYNIDIKGAIEVFDTLMP